MMAATLAFLVLSGPTPSDTRVLKGLCRAAAERKVAVEVFFMAEGVRYLEIPHLVADLAPLARLNFCALNARQKGLERHAAYPWGLEEGSQYELACIAERADHVLVFS